MPKSAVADAFEAKIGTPWNGMPVEGFDEVLADPPASTEGFIAAQFPVVSGSSPVLTRRKFEDGAARFVLNIKKEVGLKRARVLADGLADLLRRTKFGGVETFDPDGPIETDNNDDGVYIALSVVVPYRYQFDV